MGHMQLVLNCKERNSSTRPTVHLPLWKVERFLMDYFTPQGPGARRSSCKPSSRGMHQLGGVCRVAD